MSDVLYPSPAYAELTFRYDKSSDIDWEIKRNNLHWAGFTTGAYALDGKWRNFQRQRFTTFTRNLEQRWHQYLKVENGVLRFVNSKLFNIRLYDVAITKIFQCTKKVCNDQNAHFHKHGWVDRNGGFMPRFVFDVDGNGISGRFYQFLASKSVPPKQTIFREWHDE